MFSLFQMVRLYMGSPRKHSFLVSFILKCSNVLFTLIHVKFKLSLQEYVGDVDGIVVGDEEGVFVGNKVVGEKVSPRDDGMCVVGVKEGEKV